MQVHEKTCSVEDDDVILCDSPELCDNLPPERKYNNILEDNEQRIGFMLNFNLQYRNADVHSLLTHNEGVTKFCSAPEMLQKECQFMIIDKKKRISRRSRAVHSVSRCPTIPLSSPAGQLLLRTTKTSITTEYLIERLDRIERFCQAPLLSKLTSRPKFMEKRSSAVTPNCSFKKPQEYSTHVYIFPRRQFSQKQRTENILLINSTLLRRCRPISVRLKKISDMRNKQNTPSSTKLNIKLTRDNSRSSNWKISSIPSTEIIVDTIDLCTSDEDDNQMNYLTSNISNITNINNNTANTLKNCNLNINTGNKNNLINSTTTTSIQHASNAQICHQLDFESDISTSPMHNILKSAFDDSCFQQTANKTYKSNAQCLVQLVQNNIENTTTGTATLINSKNKTDSKDQDNVSVNSVKPFRPSVYILSNCSTPLTVVSTQNMNPNIEVSNEETHSQRITITNNTNTVSRNWFVREPNVSIGTDNQENSSESNEVPNSASIGVEQGHRNRTLPLIHQNRIISIDLTS